MEHTTCRQYESMLGKKVTITTIYGDSYSGTLVGTSASEFVLQGEYETATSGTPKRTKKQYVSVVMREAVVAITHDLI